MAATAATGLTLVFATESFLGDAEAAGRQDPSVVPAMIA